MGAIIFRISHLTFKVQENCLHTDQQRDQFHYGTHRHKPVCKYESKRTQISKRDEARHCGEQDINN